MWIDVRLSRAELQKLQNTVLSLFYCGLIETAKIRGLYKVRKHLTPVQRLVILAQEPVQLFEVFETFPNTQLFDLFIQVIRHKLRQIKSETQSK